MMGLERSGRKRLQGPSFFKYRNHILLSSPLAHPHPHADQATQKLSHQGILIHGEGCRAAGQTAEMVGEPVAALDGRTGVSQSPQEDLFLPVPGKHLTPSTRPYLQHLRQGSVSNDLLR